MPELSAVIITFNEERRIADCLGSVIELADEVVVVDSFSTDRTGQICKDFGVRFIPHAFEGHIQQKNYALDQATYDRVLCLDADEVISGRLQDSLKEVKNSMDHDAYSFNRLSWYCGRWIRHSTWYPSRKVRLVDRRKARWAGINPHDSLVPEPGCRVKQLKGDLLHYTYETVGEHREKILKYAELASKAYFRAGKKGGVMKPGINAAWKFLRNYFLELGFLDGYHGWTIARLDARETFLKYLWLNKLYAEQKLGKKPVQDHEPAG